ncbi:MAG TPA: MltA domain-containing protein [Candidatus Bathyarchaeia archaeon]|nr:MltA domain-containing protein [Candidatus Bathyarchaeia archaeon]
MLGWRQARRGLRGGCALAIACLASCGTLRAPWSRPARSEPFATLEIGDLAALDHAAAAALAELERPATRSAVPASSTTDGGSSPGGSSQAVAQGLVALRRLIAGSATDFRAALADTFSAGAPVPVLVTGYYEPTLRARRTPDASFRHAIYGRPDDLGSGTPLPTRAEIEAGALSGRGLELFWTDDPIELFFLQVQGSGRLELDDGTIVRVGFAGSNGQPYRAIGKDLVDRGALEPGTATAPAIKAYLRAHPDEIAPTLEANPRYVFFRVLDRPPEAGPTGSLGAELVPYRSVAIDPRSEPLGTIGVLATTLSGGRRLTTLVIAMDSGAAITGSGRLDLFLGAGPEAEAIAGELSSRGEVSWLALR